MKKQLLPLVLFFATVELCVAQNVGIGTKTPTEQLHTTKGVRHETLSGSATRLVLADSTGKLLTLKDSGVIKSNTATVPIVEGNCVVSSSSIIISGMATNISTRKIAVKINVTHALVGELVINLKAPNGQVVNLVYSDGSEGVNFTNTLFTDDAPCQNRFAGI